MRAVPVMTESDGRRILIRDLRRGGVIVLHNAPVTVERLEHAGGGFFSVCFRSREFPNGGGSLESGRHFVTLLERP